MSDQRLLHVTPTEGGLLSQYKKLRLERSKAFVGGEVYRWLETHTLSNEEEAAGYVVHTLKYLREKSPDDKTLQLERAESALRAEVVKWAPRFAKLWEGRAHFTIFTEPALDFASYLGLATHSDDTKGYDVLRTAGVIFTDAQRAIDEEALTLLASTGDEGEKLSSGIRDAIKKRDEICDRYFERRGVEKDKRHTDWDFVADANTIRGFLSLEPLKEIHDADVKKVGEDYFKEYPLEDTHPLVYKRKEIPEFVEKTGIQESEFDAFLFDLWQSETDEIWRSNIQVPRWAKWLMVALWTDVVAPQLERERLSLARVTAARIPMGVIETLHGNRQIGDSKIVGIESTVLVPLHNNKEGQLHLPLDVHVRGAKGVVALRNLFSGTDWKAYIISWLLWHREGGSMDGTFRWAAKPSLLKQFNIGGVSQGQITRVHGATFKGIQRSFDTVLTRYGISGIGIDGGVELKAKNPEPLINVHTKNGKVIHAVHAPLAMAGMREHNFAQAPESILSVDARRMPEAIGVVGFLRNYAQQIGKKGHVTKKLDAFLTDVKADRERQAKDGLAFWTSTYERYRLASEEGDLATLAIQGEGPSAIVTIEQTETMEAIYKDLYETHARKAKEAQRAAAIKATKGGGKRK